MIVFEKNDFRISLLTSRLLRTEKGAFTDLPTQTVQNREFCVPKYTLTENKKYIEIQTDDVLFRVKKSSGEVVYAFFPPHSDTKSFGKRPLPGTARTLDRANGRVRLEEGITSRFGTSVMDDSRSLLINEDGSILPRSRC